MPISWQVITLLTGFLGILLGAYLTGKFAQKNLLWNKKVEVFSELLRNIEKCLDTTIKYYEELPEGTSGQRSKHIETYSPALTSVRIARFFLAERDKDRIEYLVVHIFGGYFEERQGEITEQENITDICETKKEIY